MKQLNEMKSWMNIVESTSKATLNKGPLDKEVSRQYDVFNDATLQGQDAVHQAFKQYGVEVKKIAEEYFKSLQKLLPVGSIIDGVAPSKGDLIIVGHEVNFYSTSYPDTDGEVPYYILAPLIWISYSDEIGIFSENPTWQQINKIGENIDLVTKIFLKVDKPEGLNTVREIPSGN